MEALEKFPLTHLFFLIMEKP